MPQGLPLGSNPSLTRLPNNKEEENGTEDTE